MNQSLHMTSWPACMITGKILQPEHIFNSVHSLSIHSLVTEFISLLNVTFATPGFVGVTGQIEQQLPSFSLWQELLFIDLSFSRQTILISIFLNLNYTPKQSVTNK